MMRTVDLTAGVDVGNGYVKARAVDQAGRQVSADFPSAVAYMTGAPVPHVADQDSVSRVENLMDMQVSSSALDDGHDGARMLAGQRAVGSGMVCRVFRLEDGLAKCQDPLSVLLVLNAVVSMGLKCAWAADGALADEVVVRCRVGMALPMEDYVSHRHEYASRLVDGEHVVVVRAFAGPDGEDSVPVRVRVVFEGVHMLAEGAAAQYAMMVLGEAQFVGMLARARVWQPDLDSGWDAGMVRAARDVIGVDIGEGTTNFAVFRDGQPVLDACESIDVGFGSVLDETVRGVPGMFANRKALAEWLRRPVATPLDRSRHGKVDPVLDGAVRNYLRAMSDRFAAVWRRHGAGVQYVSVYGGGANDLAGVLVPVLSGLCAANGGEVPPVLVPDGRVARLLNRDGLFFAVNR